jgi:hypothetical protein
MDHTEYSVYISMSEKNIREENNSAVGMQACDFIGPTANDFSTRSKCQDISLRCSAPVEFLFSFWLLLVLALRLLFLF